MARTIGRLLPVGLIGLGIACGQAYGEAAGDDAGVPGTEAGIDGPGPDESGSDATAQLDAPVDADPGCTAWRSHVFDACQIPAAGGAVKLPANGAITYDTDLQGFVQDPPADPPSKVLTLGGVATVVISVASFIVPASTTLQVIGSKPLVIASWGTIDVQGTIDVGSTSTRTGAGANPASCATTAAVAGKDEVTAGGGSGGGGGGGFQGTGGMGGPGDTGGENPGGAGGMASGVASLRGGCTGARSGKAGPDPGIVAPSNANTTAPAGAGGGAILLSARQSISVGPAGRVLAGGAGGSGSPLASATGGGGGGAGGYIGLDAPMYLFSMGARFAANGGGGGSSDGFANAGKAGADGRDDGVAALGGPATACANAGGTGAAGNTLNAPAAPQLPVACGGAGGGGGAGYIVVFGSMAPSGPTFSPPLTLTNN